MDILRAKTIDLKQTRDLTNLQIENSRLNEQEAISQQTTLKSFPRRFVLELTNACNLNCIMCGRNTSYFKPTVFDTAWLKKLEDITRHVEEVTLMGWGEPTIHPEFEYFLQWAYKQGLRKYFCTNGMRLDNLFNALFETKTDIIGISLDGADAKTNETIRKGSDFNKIIDSLEKISRNKELLKIEYPYMNFVFTAMKSNIKQLPQLIKLAADIGIQEVKVVFLTVFDMDLMHESLFEHMEYVKEIFQVGTELAQKNNIALKLPYLYGEDPAGDDLHKTCYTGWRDFFLGSDGYIRPCMSTSDVLFHIDEYDNFLEMWNSYEYKNHRGKVNNITMNESCKNCYQSSFANWNKQSSFQQVGNVFSPTWK